MTHEQPYKILFLCTGNSARSILGEFLIKELGKGKFESYSAGADPKGEVNPFATEVLKTHFGIDASEARSKSWDEFSEKGMQFDFVITVCDNAKETCPVWPGQPVIAHWSSPDPAAFEGTDEETEHYFFLVAMQIRRRIELLCSLPIDKLDQLRLENATREIGDEATELEEPAEA